MDLVDQMNKATLYEQLTWIAVVIIAALISVLIVVWVSKHKEEEKFYRRREQLYEEHDNDKQTLRTYFVEQATLYEKALEECAIRLGVRDRYVMVDPNGRETSFFAPHKFADDLEISLNLTATEEALARLDKRKEYPIV